MKRGPKGNPAYRRFDCLNAFGHAIYLVEMGGGVIKVGKSHYPPERMRGLFNQAKRSGHALGRVRVFRPSYARDLWWDEYACIHALAIGARAVDGRREYFTGLAFDDAAAIIATTLTPSNV